MSFREYYFTSDHHFSHKNIIKYAKRPFQTVEEMNEFMIEQWNKKVGQQDQVFYLGDFSMSKAYEDIEPIIKRLNGKIYFIVGNHDNKQIWNRLMKNNSNIIAVEDVKGVSLPRQDGSLQYFWLSHYPHREWNRSYNGGMHLYGHVHGRSKPLGKSMDVGVDASPDFSPFSLSEVLEILDKRKQENG